MEEKLDRAVKSVRGDFAISLAQTTAQQLNSSGLLLLLGPQRSGTTWFYDVMRSLHGSQHVPLRDVYSAFQIAGGRYPRDLASNTQRGIAIENSEGESGYLTYARSSLLKPHAVAVEKLHPSALDLSESKMQRCLKLLEEEFGVVRIALAVREPSASFLSYQRRSNWHAESP